MAPPRSALEPFLGRWELDPNQSVYQFGTPPASGVYVIDYDGVRLRFVIEWTTAEGQAMQTTVEAIPDGQDHPYDAPGVDAINYELTPDGALDSTAKRGAAVVAYARRRLSEDGQLMFIRQQGQTPTGQAFTNASVYLRR